MGDEAGRMTAEPCAGCGCKWKRCKPDTPGSDTGVVVCAYCGTFQSRYEFTDLPAAPVGGDEGQTDLPDAVAEAAAEVIHREVTWATGDDSKRIACAVLAVASGPWAEHLDARATRAEHRLGSVAKELGMDEPDTPVRPITFEDRRWDDLRKHVGGMLSERDALRAELNNLRTRLNALADKWQDSEFRRKQPVLAYVGLDVAARDLTADREAFDREVARKGAEVGRMNAAIVRGSDDEAGSCTCGESVPTVTTPGPCYWAENAPGVQSQVHCPPADGVAR